MDEIYIQADLLVDGAGSEIRDSIIKISGDVISKVGSSDEIKIPDGKEVINTPFAMPGLWDCHTHLMGGKSLDMIKWMEEPPTLRAIRTTYSARKLLEAGYTSIRDVGGPFALRLKQAILEGTAQGPNVYAAHKFISQTAGHGDNHTTPIDWQSSEHAAWYGRVADGVAECRKATREQIREGADLIKIFATGGVLSHIDSPIQAHFTMDELKAIVEEANRFDLATAAHAHGNQGVKNAINAGITTVEHGTYLEEDTAQLMKQKGVILVPTFTIIDKLVENAEKTGVPQHIIDKVKLVKKLHVENVKIAIKEGVKIASGSDLLGVDDAYQHGFTNAAELEHLHKAGLSKMEAITAATGMAPKTLGPRAPKSGRLKEGYKADILCLDKNLLDDLTILQRKDYLSHVIKSGKVVASYGKLHDS